MTDHEHYKFSTTSFYWIKMKTYLLPLAMLMCLPLLNGCVSNVTLVPGADQVLFTELPADVTGCKPVGNVGNHLDISTIDAPSQMRNETVALGGNVAFVTYDPTEHFISSGETPLKGIAYFCENRVALKK